MSRRRTRVPQVSALLLVVTGVLTMGAAGPASAAAVRYASPSGTLAESCATPAEACRIDKAINDAADQDTVVLAPGTYSPVVALSNNAVGLTVRGTLGQPRPVLVVSTPNGLGLNGVGVTVTDLAIRHTGTSVGLFVFSSDALVERVDVRSSGGDACTAGISGVFRDSLCVTTANGKSAFKSSFSSGVPSTDTLEIRNVTAVALGSGGIGLSIGAGNNTTNIVKPRNVIARGDTIDVKTSQSGSGSASVVLSFSNYDSVDTSLGGSATAPGTPTNQTIPPVFADTVLYHQATTSPTVDAGASDAIVGSKDLDGQARSQGAAVDIGVDEIDNVPPQTAIVKRPGKKTTRTKARFTFSSTESGSTFFCKLDKRRAKPCTSPYRKRSLKVGKHKFKVYAVDPVGNRDRTPSVARWKIKPRRVRA